MKNKFKQITALIMAAAAVLFGFSTAVTAETVSNGNSNADIEFTPGEGAPEVVDPEDPEVSFPDPEDRDDGDPIDPPTGETGPLTLDFVSSVAFGEHKVDSETAVYESETLRPFIQVTDRRGTAEGWSVTAQADSIEVDSEDEGAEATLPGAALTFSNGEVVSTGTSDEPVTAAEVVLNTGGDSAQVVTAAVDTGMGKWINRWFPSEDGAESNDNVTLEIPGGSATQGAHTATVAWTLSDAPGQ